MADNVSITPGSGASIATDDVGGAHYQRVKLDGGGDGAAAPIGGDAANGLDVDVTRMPAPAAAMLAAGLTAKTAQYTTQQTGTALVTPAAGKKIVVTKVQVQVGGTTAGTFQLWFGASGDTTYTRGTELAIFDGEFAPSATLKPGVVMDGPFISGTADHLLRVTTSAAINPITVTVWFYEV